jgi:ATP synthase protein I
MNEPDDNDRMGRAAQQASSRDRAAREEPEPSLGSRLGQIGILGWSIVIPTLLGLVIGAAFGLWSAWKWMHRQTRDTHHD